MRKESSISSKIPVELHQSLLSLASDFGMSLQNFLDRIVSDYVDIFFTLEGECNYFEGETEYKRLLRKRLRRIEPQLQLVRKQRNLIHRLRIIMAQKNAS